MRSRSYIKCNSKREGRAFKIESIFILLYSAYGDNIH